MSEQRIECQRFLKAWRDLLDDKLPKKEPWMVLEVGIAGDPKPGGNYELFLGDYYYTLDVDAAYEPTYVLDLCDQAAIRDQSLHGKFDVVIVSNVLEHIFDLQAAFLGARLLLKDGGYLIADSPWLYPYHAEDGFEDYWRISKSAMEELLRRSGFEDVLAAQGTYVTTSLSKKAL